MPKQVPGTLGVLFGLHFVILAMEVEQTLETQAPAQAPDILVVASDLHFATLVQLVERKLYSQGLGTWIVAVALCLI